MEPRSIDFRAPLRSCDPSPPSATLTPMTTSPLASAVDAMKAHVPTSRHAEMLFEILVDLLGDQGVLWTANEGRLRKLFRRDPIDATLVVPWPVAQLSIGGRIGWVSPTIDTRTGEVVPELELPPGKPSRLRGLGPAEIDLHEGQAHINLVFGETGAYKETSIDDRVPSRLSEIPVAIASKRAPPVELIATCIACFDPGVHGRGRVHVPVPVPGGPEGTWQVGLLAARRALFSGRVPADARYLVADGVSGAAVGWGPTLAAATGAFDAEVAASPPAPDRTMHTAWDDYDDVGNLIKRGEMPEPEAPKPWETSEGDEPWKPARPPGTIDLTGGAVRITGPTPDVPLPPITVATVPRAIIPLAGSPPFAPPLGCWERTIGARGATAHVARLVRAQGFLQVGEQVIWRVDPRTLDEVLDGLDAQRAEADAALHEASPYREFVRFRSSTYRWADARNGRPAGLEWAGGSSGPVFDGVALDGDIEAVVVRRHVKIPRST